MLFNSIDFAFFLPIVFGIYWLFHRSRKLQNLIILISSYIFYGWWDWRFLSLIALSTILDYFIGLQLGKSQQSDSNKKLLLFLSLFFNLGALAFFKYFNFFIENFSNAFSFFGSNLDAVRLDIILPVGISFYTFQTLSYSIDVYRGKISPTKNLLSFASFVSFFPQLVAGPIERASHLLPQFEADRKFDYAIASDGMRQILWGFFKKIVIADRCAIIVNGVFDNYETMNGSTLLIGALAFSFQIYGDFSGYSDIAIGTSKLFGFDLMTNFKTPYFSRNIAEFWNRWHISLSTWFRDYLYIPLGGSRFSQFVTLRNVIIVFVVSGLWHGANWTFVVWGALNGLLFIPLLLFNKHKTYNRANSNFLEGSKFKKSASIISTFMVVTLLWIIFRSASIVQAFEYISGILSPTILSKPIWIKEFLIIAFWIGFLLLIEWSNRDKEHQFSIGNQSAPVRRTLYLIVILGIFFFGKFESNSFIYFQF